MRSGRLGRRTWNRGRCGRGEDSTSAPKPYSSSSSLYPSAAAEVVAAPRVTGSWCKNNGRPSAGPGPDWRAPLALALKEELTRPGRWKSAPPTIPQRPRPQLSPSQTPPGPRCHAPTLRVVDRTSYSQPVGFGVRRSRVVGARDSPEALVHDRDALDWQDAKLVFRRNLARRIYFQGLGSPIRLSLQ